MSHENRKKIIDLIIYICLFFLAGLVYCNQGGSVYTIARGDTLAKIANRFYHDPTMWRVIHRANPAITNPNVLSPGKQIIIPMSVEENRPSPGSVTSTQTVTQGKGKVTGKPKKNQEESFIAGEKWEFDGHVTGQSDRKLVISQGDTVFLDFGRDHGAKPTDRYNVYRKDRNIVHPETGENMGSVIRKIAVLEILDDIGLNTCAAKVIMAREPILIGDFVKKQ